MDERRARGRPRDPAISDKVLTAAMTLLRASGYDDLRMEEVAAAAGVGLGTIYRRWPSKHQLIAAALASERTDSAEPNPEDPVEDLLAALLRVCQAIDSGLGRIIAECLQHPESELATIARDVKLDPLADAIRGRLLRFSDQQSGAAEIALGYLLWHTAMHRTPPDRALLEQDLIPRLITASFTRREF